MLMDLKKQIRFTFEIFNEKLFSFSLFIYLCFFLKERELASFVIPKNKI